MKNEQLVFKLFQEFRIDMNNSIFYVLRPVLNGLGDKIKYHHIMRYLDYIVVMPSGMNMRRLLIYNHH